MHLAARFEPLASHYQELVTLIRTVTGGRVYVRSGAHWIAGGRGPAHLPTAGRVTSAGRVWSVYSWMPSAGTRVYLLTPPVRTS